MWSNVARATLAKLNIAINKPRLSKIAKRNLLYFGNNSKRICFVLLCVVDMERTLVIYFLKPAYELVISIRHKTYYSRMPFLKYRIQITRFIGRCVLRSWTIISSEQDFSSVGKYVQQKKLRKSVKIRKSKCNFGYIKI